MTKKTSLKDVCFKCDTFDNTQRGGYKCAIKGRCPGLDWPMSKRQRVIYERKKAKKG